VRDLDELREFIAVFRKHKVHFSFNTDGPEMLQTTLRDELKLAVRANLVSRDELAQCGEWAREASFLLKNGA
jgi:adenosine deaminase